MSGNGRVLLECDDHAPVEVVLGRPFHRKADVPPCCLIVALIEKWRHGRPFDSDDFTDMILDEDHHGNPAEREEQISRKVVEEGPC